ncbi:uncharacterized protein LOC134257604 [Saccostrea cucullata]|uniref:uncharacterized protein LOC134257604 n=1 Tax=Saccostrea cuccullata TaxID=36930 RepID=UPI002ED52E34
MTEKQLRFVNLSSSDLNNLIEKKKKSVNTIRVISSSVSVLRSFCDETGRDVSDLYAIPKSELQEFLKVFYGGLRSADGEAYAKRSMISIRHGLQKYFMKKRKIDIVNDSDFKEANTVFLAMCAKIKKEGKGAVVHKEPITRSDLQKLYMFFNVETAQGLQDKVFVHYMLYFCNRGRENLIGLRISDFSTGTDSEGRRFIFKQRDHATKNHKDDESNSQGGRMYELKDQPHCPYSSFVTYIEKLNKDLDVLWQRPSNKSQLKYDKVAVGKNTLAEKMKNLSKNAGLSKIYTNHCLRATSITELDRSGFEARHITSISGHQSESSIRSCSAHVCDEKKMDMAMSISRAIMGDSVLAEKTKNVLGLSTNPAAVLPPQNADGEDDITFEDIDFLEITNSQEQHMLETVFTSETRKTSVNREIIHVPVDSRNAPLLSKHEEKENRNLKFQHAAPVMNFHGSTVNVHYHYY